MMAAAKPVTLSSYTTPWDMTIFNKLSTELMTVKIFASRYALCALRATIPSHDRQMRFSGPPCPGRLRGGTGSGTLPGVVVELWVDHNIRDSPWRDAAVAKLSLLDSKSATNPIDAVEEVVQSYEWSFDRQGKHEMAAQVAGQWCDLHMWFAWRAETRSLFYTCALDMRVPDNRRVAVYPLLAKINERLWFGHFELWSEEGWPTFRHTLLGGRDAAISTALVEEMVESARGECDRFYPAFQFVIWGGKSAEGAIEAALIDAAGEA